MIVAAVLSAVLAAAVAAPIEGKVGRDLTVRTTLFADGQARPGAWTQADVELANAGPDRTVVLTLAAEVPDGGTAVERVTRVDLPRGTSKVVTLTWPTANLWLPATLVVTAGMRSESFELPLESAGDGLSVVVVGSEAPGLLAAAAERPMAVAWVDPAHLPLHWAAWSSVELVVWPEVDVTRASPRALEALRTFVGGGGGLVLTVTEGATALGASPLAPLLPIAPQDAAVVSLDGAVLGIPVTDSPVFRVSGRATADAEVHVRDVMGEPVLASRNHGAGRVVMLGARPDVLGSDSLAPMWRALVDEAQRVPRAEGALDVPWAARSRIEDIPGLASIALGTLALVAALYLLVIGPMDYFVLRAARLQPLTWLSFPVTVVAFSAGTLGWIRSEKGDAASMNELAVIDHLGDGEWQGDHIVGVFVPGRARLAVTFDEVVGAWAPQLQGGFLEDVVATSPDRLAWRAETWTLGIVRGAWRGQLAYEPQLAIDDNVLRYDLPFALDEAYLLRDGVAEGLGRLEGRGTVELTGTAPPPEGWLGALILGGWSARELTPLEGTTLLVGLTQHELPHAHMEGVSATPRRDQVVRLLVETAVR